MPVPTSAASGPALAAFALGALASACAALAFRPAPRSSSGAAPGAPSLLHREDPGDDGPPSGPACIYLDHAATTPVYPEVLAEMLPYLRDHFGNPSSSHAYGREPRRAVARARRRVMRLLRDDDDDRGKGDSDDEGDEDGAQEIIFNGCGTEADNLAVQLALRSTAHRDQTPHVVTCAIEHPAVLACLEALRARGEIDLAVVPVDSCGAVAVPDVAAAIHERTVLVTIMAANNEVGTLNPIRPIAELCRARGVLFHTDAAQAAGKVSVALADLGGPDLVTLVGHKMGAPKGVAALYVRRGCLAEAGRAVPAGYGAVGLALVGGGQERGRRAGTENVPHIVGMGRAAGLLAEGAQWRRDARAMEGLRARLLDRLVRGLGGAAAGDVAPNGPADPSRRLPNVLSVGVRGLRAGDLLREIGERVAASAGSACHASGGGISQVLRELRVPRDFARGTLRLSVGPRSTAEEVDAAADIIIEAAKRQLEQGRKQ